jgi:two-component system phosphate regulon sensor histidine kinase PhoR
VPKKGVERLIYIVEDLDMITKLEVLFKFDYSEFDIVELIQNVFDLLEMKADKKENTPRLLKTIIFSLILLRQIKQQVIENLIVNLY